MGVTKNNPQARGKTNTKKKLNGKDIEPILVVSGEGKFMGAKYSKTTNIICDNIGNPIAWKDIVSEK
jgi:hypothetical protein